LKRCTGPLRSFEYIDGRRCDHDMRWFGWNGCGGGLGRWAGIAGGGRTRSGRQHHGPVGEREVCAPRAVAPKSSLGKIKTHSSLILCSPLSDAAGGLAEDPPCLLYAKRHSPLAIDDPVEADD
jgi:hypothetical protein